MISKAFINKSRDFFKSRIPILIVLLGGLTRFYTVKQRFYFDFDQQVPAEAAYLFFKSHRLSLIGQELSFKGFFLGPLHNWIAFIPYGACNLFPDCVPFFYAGVSVLVLMFFYYLNLKLINFRTAIIAGAIYCVSATQLILERSVNSNYFLFLSSILLLYCAYKYFYGSRKHALAGAFIAGLATVNFNPLFLFSSIAFFLTIILLNKKAPLRLFLLAAFIYIMNFLPLLIFNIKHNNIIYLAATNFLHKNIDHSITTSLTFLLFHINLPFLATHIFANANVIFQLLILIIIIYATTLLLKDTKKYLLLLPLTLLCTFIGLSFYKGHIPDYYFQQTLPYAVILVAYVISKNTKIASLLLIGIIIANYSIYRTLMGGINYQAKKSVVKFITSDSGIHTFKQYYQTPLGMNEGYSYIFKVYNKEPQDYGEYLYIIDLINTPFDDYRESFKDKKVMLNKIDKINVISVK